MKILTTQKIPRLLDCTQPLGYANLLVSGCSFTSINFGQDEYYLQTLKSNYYNLKQGTSWPDIHSGQDWDQLPEHIKIECQQDHKLDWRHLTYVTWPTYIRDYFLFDQVIDCSCSGAGNKHIHDSLIYQLETDTAITPDNTIVAVMWSGFDRDDFIVDPDSINLNNVNQYAYTDQARLMITGGLLGNSNGVISIDVIKKIKSEQSRALENYIYVAGLYHYLVSRGFKFLFTMFSSNIKETGLHLDQNLTPTLLNNFNSMISVRPYLGDFAQDTIDTSHPTTYWHSQWAQSVLAPCILQLIDSK
jgi:hypothetical protein